MRHKATYFLTIIICNLLFISCGSQKKNIFSKGYHNTTTLFNWYYNANLIYEEGVAKVNSDFEIPAEGLIPLLYYGDEEGGSSGSSDFMTSIEKCEIAILKHPNSKWVKNCRFLIGKNQFYMGKYYVAKQNFEWVVDEYPDAKITPEVYIWIARTYYYSGRKNSALQVLQTKVKNSELGKKEKGELALLKATIHIENGDLEEATKTLERSIRNQKGRLNRARVHFILGQLYERRDRMARAYEHYDLVTRINTDYKLIFAAELRKIRLMALEMDGAEGDQKIRKEIKRLLRDEKNKDYQDQLYYELALIDLKSDRYDDALANLQKSTNNSTQNARQKALSFYKAGQIYFYNLRNFSKAETKFDSASVFITEDAPEYDEITRVGKTLKEYVNYITTIEYQDSMLWLANMSTGARAQAVQKVINEEKRRDQEKLKEEQQQMMNQTDPNFLNQFQNQNKGSSGGSGFYFNNQEQVSNGKVQFQSRWGRRKNEDNWRRKYKALTFSKSENDTEEEEKQEAGMTKEDSLLADKYGDNFRYYKDIPNTEEEKEEARNKVKNALFGLGQLFDKKLEMPDSAIVVFNKLIKRFPESEEALKARFALYGIYVKKDPFKAEKVKNYICSNHPTTIYCKLIKGENVEEELASKHEKFKGAYAALYPTYSEGDYSTVISFANFILGRYPGEEDIPRVHYMKGLSYGELGKIDSLKKIFIHIRDNYPSHEVTPVVKLTLQKLGLAGGGEEPEKLTRSEQEKKKNETDSDSEEKNEKYKGFVKTKKSNEKYMVVILVGKDEISSNKLKMAVSNFNQKNFSSNKLTVSIFFYKNKQHLGYITQFNSAGDALKYINKVSENPEIKPLLKNKEDMAVFITPTNFKTAYSKKRFEDYYEFYQDIILPGIND